MKSFFPENAEYLKSQGMQNLTAAEGDNDKADICYGVVKKCDKYHNLLVKMDDKVGLIPFEESAIGASEGKIKEISIISKVGKVVSFVNTGKTICVDDITYPCLSRKQAQIACKEEFLANLQSGDIIDAVITHFEPFGAFVDVGCGIVSLLPIDCISVSRISHPADRFLPGEQIKVVVTGTDEFGRLTISHKELLGTWSENAALFEMGETVFGVVRSVESYGIFVELTPNLAGLAEIKDNIKEGDFVSVFIKSILPEKMKIKLIVIDKIAGKQPPTPSNYFLSDNHIDEFYYSPLGCAKSIYRKF